MENEKEEFVQVNEEPVLETEKEIITEDKYFRLLADLENYKKRHQKEKEEIKNNTKTMMLSAILDLDSDLSIAVKSSKDQEGIKLIMMKLEKFLNNQGVESIQTDTYDPDLHDVVSVLEIGEEKIVDVVSKGYKINGVTFRYPKIVLGK